MWGPEIFVQGPGLMGVPEFQTKPLRQILFKMFKKEKIIKKDMFFDYNICFKSITHWNTGLYFVC